MYKLTPSREPIANALGRKSHKSFANHALKNDNVRRYVVVGLRKFLKSEIKCLSSHPYLLNKSKESLSSFSWDSFYEVLKVQAPTILAFLDACVFQSSSLNTKVVVGVCAAILAKARRPAASLFQHIISIILYSGHSGQKVAIIMCIINKHEVQIFKLIFKVFARLQKLGICLSSSGTLRAVEKLGKRHDEEVLNWVECLQPLVPTTQVN